MNEKEKKIIKYIIKKKGTPFYLYNLLKILRNIKKIERYFASIPHELFYSLKANFNFTIVKNFRNYISGIESSSDLEFNLAKKITSNILHHLVGINSSHVMKEVRKTAKYIILDNLEITQRFLGKDNKTNANIAFRVNIETGSSLDTKFKLGGKESKLGMDEEELLSSIKFLTKNGYKTFGLMAMEASNVVEFTYFVNLIEILNKLADNLEDQFDINFEFIDIGGGFGFDYSRKKELDFIKLVKTLNKKKLNKRKLIFESGRFIVANSGYLILKIKTVKKRANKFIYITDGGENIFLRKAWFGVNHKVDFISDSNRGNEKLNSIIAGPNLDNSDIVVESVLPKLGVGDIVVLKDVGAYGSVRMSNFGGNLFCPEFLIKEEGIFEVRKRQDMICFKNFFEEKMIL